VRDRKRVGGKGKLVHGVERKGGGGGAFGLVWGGKGRGRRAEGNVRIDVECRPCLI
jgi:hypothetical protein